MKLSPVTSVLEREIETLQELLALAQSQSELLEAGRTEDLQIVSSFRSALLPKLAAIEQAADAVTSHIQDDCVSPAKASQDVEELNLEILHLVDRIVNTDEKSKLFMEECEAAGMAE